MSKLNLFAALSLVIGVSSAYANTAEVFGGGPGDKAGPKKAVSLEEMKDRCLNPLNYDVQRQPQNIVIKCSDVRLNWTAGKPGAVSLNGLRHVTAGVTANKFETSAITKEVPVEAKGGTCNRFTEMQETVAVERGLTCDELLSVKGDVVDFCAGAVDATKGSNPKLVDIVETGRVIDTCAAASVSQKGNN
ncbi:MAG: hypothetical protein H7222_15625 [Methylotenera sp.]|nr:hypothetical protein [Oligoflexia bacterium]